MLGMPVKGALTKADTTYAVTADLGRRCHRQTGDEPEAGGQYARRSSPTMQGYQVKGDVKINGQQASLDYRKPTEGDADIKLQATLDDASRARLGLDLGPAVSGAIPIKADRQDRERRSRQPGRRRGRSHRS